MTIQAPTIAPAKTREPTLIKTMTATSVLLSIAIDLCNQFPAALDLAALKNGRDMVFDRFLSNEKFGGDFFVVEPLTDEGCNLLLPLCHGLDGEF